MASSVGKYTSLDGVMQDYQAYVKLRNGGSLSMADIPIIAVNRWLSYFVANWDTSLRSLLRGRFVGDDIGLALIKKLGDDVLTQQLSPTSPINPFLVASKMSAYKYLIESIALEELNLNADEIKTVNDEQARILNLQITDFKEMSRFLRKLACDSTQIVGLGDTEGVEIQGFSEVAAQRPYYVSDLEQIRLILEISDEIDGIVFDLKNKFDVSPNLLQIDNNNIDATSSVSLNQNYLSAIAVPFRGTLEQMAKDFLGSADLLMELVTVNGLQPPYVDLNGSKQLLVGPGIKNFVKISAQLKNYIKVGVKVGVGSLTVKEEFRTVEKIIDQNDGNLTLGLSGTDNLGRLKLVDQPYVRVYKPGTVNERSLILIPLDVRSPNPRRQIPNSDALRRLDQALLDFGVDVKRDENTNGFVLSPEGDLQMCYGVPAVRQAVLSALRTNTNELPWHPEYGVPLADTIGSRFLADIGAGAAIGNVVTGVLQSDGRYSFVVMKDVKVTPNSTSISIVIGLPGSSILIPLDFVS